MTQSEETLIANENSESPTPSFESLSICPELLLAVQALNWKTPTAIQQQAIPPALAGKDLIALASTGSGKTGAFALPILQSLLQSPQRLFALILAPTRELCVQIAETFEALGAGISLQTAVLVGGLDMVTQALQLAKKPHIVVASPGRLVDHLQNTKGFSLRTIRYLVLDEADRLLSMDFEDAINIIVAECKRPDRQTFLFSATMTSKVAKIEKVALKNAPVKIEINSKYDTAENLQQFYALIPFKFKLSYLFAVLSRFKGQTVIVFIDTCLNAQKTTSILRNLQLSAVCLHGQMTQQQRLGALNQFKSGTKKILVCTDVAARGLDIPSVQLVINYDLPKCQKDYVHRVGRTARAGREGLAIALVTQYDVENFKKVELFLQKELTEYGQVAEADMIAVHAQVMEASRLAHLEMKEKEEEVKESLGKGGSKNKVKVKKMLLKR